MQGGPDGGQPVAYAAVRYTLAEGETPTSLTLTVATASASTPGVALAVCQLTATFTPEQGGSMAKAPNFDCGAKQTGSPASGGANYTFDVARFASDGALAVAILPTAPTDRVVLAKPGVESLQSSASAGGSLGASTSDYSSEPTADAPQGNAAADTAAASLDRGFDLPAAPVPEPATQVAATPGASQDPTRPAPEPSGVAAEPAAITAGHGRSKLPTIAFGGLALTAAALWMSAGRRVSRPA